MKKLILYILIVSSFLISQDQLFVGTRPLGMGGAFIAVADDGNTITWNPAGLPRLRRKEFTSSYADLYAMDISHSYTGIVWPFGDRVAVGFDWANVGFDDQELSYSENKLHFSLPGYFSTEIFVAAARLAPVFRISVETYSLSLMC